MQTFFLITQISVALLLTVVILLQSQGSGLGSVWGGGGESYHTKRGVEKVLLYLTIVGICIFGLVAIANSIVM